MEKLHVGDLITKVTDSQGYLKDPPGTCYTVEAIIHDTDAEEETDIVFFRHTCGDLAEDLIADNPQHDLSALQVGFNYMQSWQRYDNPKWKLAKPGMRDNPVESKEKTVNLSDQARKNREFFFKDLVKPYSAPTDENGRRIGLEFL